VEAGTVQFCKGFFDFLFSGGDSMARRLIRVRFCRPDGTMYWQEDKMLEVDTEGKKACYEYQWYRIKEVGGKLVIDVV